MDMLLGSIKRFELESFALGFRAVQKVKTYAKKEAYFSYLLHSTVHF